MNSTNLPEKDREVNCQFHNTPLEELWEGIWICERCFVKSVAKQSEVDPEEYRNGVWYPEKAVVPYDY